MPGWKSTINRYLAISVASCFPAVSRPFHPENEADRAISTLMLRHCPMRGDEDRVARTVRTARDRGEDPRRSDARANRGPGAGARASRVHQPHRSRRHVPEVADPAALLR